MRWNNLFKITQPVNLFFFPFLSYLCVMSAIFIEIWLKGKLCFNIWTSYWYAIGTTHLAENSTFGSSSLGHIWSCSLVAVKEPILCSWLPMWTGEAESERGPGGKSHTSLRENRQCSQEVSADPSSLCCYVVRRRKSDSGSSNSSRQSASAFASGEGVFTETSRVYRERLWNNNFHVQGYGTFLIICVKMEFECFKREGWEDDFNYYL